jgi:hypothetical protein
MLNKKVLTVLCLVFFAVNALTAQNKYVGAKTCKMCHNNPAKGEQYNKWSSTQHSKAFTALSSDKALTYAKANGIADPSKEAKCLKCHSTAASVDASLLSTTITKEEGVSCESCHGAGSAYKTMTIMKDKPTAITNGLIIPDQKTCETCHKGEGNPFPQTFDYATYLAKISHKDPSHQ